MEAVENISHMTKRDYEAYVSLMIRRIDQTEHMLHKRVREEVQSLFNKHAHHQKCLNK